MRVLFTTPVLEHPAAGGPQLRIENSIKALSSVCEKLYVVSRVHKDDMGGDSAESFYRSYCNKFLYAPSAMRLRLHANRPIRVLQRMYRRLVCNTTDARFILEVAARERIDVIWFGYGNISFPLMNRIKLVKPDMRVVCDTDSVWSRFVLRELPFESDPLRRFMIKMVGRKKELEEKTWVNLCDATTAVSEVDAEYYRDLAGDPGRIKLFSNVIDLASYELAPAPPAGFKRPCMYLAGTFGPKSPMDKAARWVIKDILPIVKKTLPDIHFYMVGSGSNEVFSDIDDPSVTVTGKLTSVLPYLCNADVSLVPLQFESGTRFKILEAGACKVPIVSTTLGAEGIPVVHGEHIIVADESGEFAKGIIKIITDKAFAKKLAVNCRALIHAHYSIGSLAHEAKEILNYVKGLEKTT